MLRRFGAREFALVGVLFAVLYASWLSLTPTSYTSIRWQPTYYGYAEVHVGETDQSEESKQETAEGNPVDLGTGIDPVSESEADASEESSRVESLPPLSVDEPPAETPSDELRPADEAGDEIEKLRRKVNEPGKFEFYRSGLEIKAPEDLSPTTFSLHYEGLIAASNLTVCGQCQSQRCSSDCAEHGSVVSLLRERSVESDEARLHVIPVDPLAWRWGGQGPDLAKDALVDFVNGIKKSYHYRTFKGSDHAFVCLSPACSELGGALSELLAGNMGSRAIFLSRRADRQKLEWPCPLRVVDVDSDGSAESLAQRVLAESSAMIHERNRWLCSDVNNPPNHWEGVTTKRRATGVFMREHGFTFCAIPKCGSTMSVTLFRRMNHVKNWNPFAGGGKPQWKRGGIKWVASIDNSLKKAINEDLSFVHGVIIRHPITRLLSAYLDKIQDKKEYGRIGASAYVKSLKKKNLKFTFPVFVKFLVKKHPNPNNLDHHFRILSSFCNMRHNELDFYGRQDNQFEEFREFARSLEFWDEYGSNGWGNGTQAFGEKSYQGSAHDSKTMLWDYYTDELIAIVYDYYKEDFDRFGFTVEEIMKTKPGYNQTAAL